MVAKKCKSQTFPCKAGKRCPDHKYMLSTVSTQQRVTSLLHSKQVGKVTLISLTGGSSELDKNLCFSLADAFNNDVDVTLQQEKIAFTFRKFAPKNGLKLSVQDEVNVLCSLVANTNSNLYSYGSKVPFSDEAYFVAGFERNPFYKSFVGEVSAEELDRVNRGWAKEAKVQAGNPGNPVNHLRKLAKYPYVKVKGGFRLSDYVNVPFNRFGNVFKAEKQRMKLFVAGSENSKMPVSSLV